MASRLSCTSHRACARGYVTDIRVVQVPYTLERLIAYGIFICLDSFLFVFSALPIRTGIALYHLIIRGRTLQSIQKVDVLKMILLVLGYLFLRLIDIPRHTPLSTVNRGL